MPTPTPLFTSTRERRLWLWSLAVVAAIYSTLGLAGSLAARLRENNLMGAAVLVLMTLTVATIVGSGLRRRPGRRELWVGLGLTAVYGMAVLRMGAGPEERTHLFEYGIVAVLIYQALRERARGRVRGPGAGAARPGRHRAAGLAGRGDSGAASQPGVRRLRRPVQRDRGADRGRGERGAWLGE